MAVTEKEQFLQAWEREFQTTLKVMKAYPGGRDNLQPHGKCPSAKELAWKISGEESLFVDGVVAGAIDFTGHKATPATVTDVVEIYEKQHREHVDKVRALSDDQLNREMNFMVAPKTPGKVRSGDILWMMLMDTIHHRGQFSVYLRMADGKVPSIYGPSADEPWM